ncbi:MAG: iron chelate uptake ABC transporter family permease subunit, partial [Desulfovibrio sp.]|nr:iron chelate uptake ABC transporter family permease subunit [Desulfovibrio sp.]
RFSRDMLLCAASCVAAACVSVCGVIGFVGLVVPHMARIIFGPGHGTLLAASFFGGGLFLLLADCAARVILSGGQELPAGVLTSLVGGPFFAWLVWKR